jgi:hypothetical protein
MVDAPPDPVSDVGLREVCMTLLAVSAYASGATAKSTFDQSPSTTARGLLDHCLTQDQQLD